MRCSPRTAAPVLWIMLMLFVSACQSNNPPVPTAIPQDTITPTPTESPQQPVGSATPEPSLAPIFTSTALAPTAAPVAAEPTIAPTAGPHCYVVKENETLLMLITRAGYSTLDILAEVRALNNMGQSNDIRVGQEVCIPRQTNTPTPQGYEATVAARLTEVGNVSGPTNRLILVYPVVAGDTLISLQIKTGLSLRELCELNHPEPLNCGQCQIDKPIGEQACRPTIREGAQIRYYGPTPTPTITPTLTGSETPTATPIYRSPRVIAPLSGERITGAAQLIWLPPTVLQPEEYYLVLMTDSTSGVNRTFETEATSFRIPAHLQPTDVPHTINWQVVVARKGEDGAHIQVGRGSLIYTFVWEPRS